MLACGIRARHKKAGYQAEERRVMKKKRGRVWKILALLPVATVCSHSTCQSDALRQVASELDQQADDLDGSSDRDLGEFLSDLVEDL